MTLNACFFHKRTAEHAAGEPLPGKDSRNCLTLPNHLRNSRFPALPGNLPSSFLFLFPPRPHPGGPGKNSAHPLPPLPEGNIEKRTPYKTILSFPPEREWGIMTAHTNH